MANNVLVRPAATSWMSVLGGWIATIGAAALVAPAVAGIVGRISVAGNDITPAVPVIVGIFVSYLIGGYVAGRMAGYSERLQGLWQAMKSELDLSIPQVEHYPLPQPLYAQEIGDGLYNSERDYLEQLEAYKEFQGKLQLVE